MSLSLAVIPSLDATGVPETTSVLAIWEDCYQSLGFWRSFVSLFICLWRNCKLHNVVASWWKQCLPATPRCRVFIGLHLSNMAFVTQRNWFHEIEARFTFNLKLLAAGVLEQPDARTSDLIMKSGWSHVWGVLIAQFPIASRRCRIRELSDGTESRDKIYSDKWQRNNIIENRYLPQAVFRLRSEHAKVFVELWYTMTYISNYAWIMAIPCTRHALRLSRCSTNFCGSSWACNFIKMMIVWHFFGFVLRLYIQVVYTT